MSNIFEVILVGGGPACISAAIQLKRSGIEPCIITNSIGGLARNANLIENLLGFPMGITGEEFVKKLKQQIQINNINIIYEKVISALKTTQNAETYIVKTQNTTNYTKILIIGTGTLPKQLKIEGEPQAIEHHKLFYDIYKAKENCGNKNIIILGSGDAAYDYSLNIASTAESVRIIQRSPSANCLPVLLQRVKNNPKIEIISNQMISKFTLEENGISMSSNTERYFADIVFVAIGRIPNISFISKSLLNSRNKGDEPFLYLIGDIHKRRFRQISIAMGDGINTAMEIVKKLRSIQ
jgi:thioredoxin reductase (NADPH)